MKTATCKYCHRDGLEWKQLEGKWVLACNGRRHVCSSRGEGQLFDDFTVSANGGTRISNKVWMGTRKKVFVSRAARPDMRPSSVGRSVL